MSVGAGRLLEVAPARPRPRHPRRWRAVLADGERTTVHVASYAAEDTAIRLAVLRPAQPLEAWCAREGVRDAMVAGFFTRPRNVPLGELRTRGVRRRSVPFLAPWDGVRACVHLLAGEAALAPRPELPREPQGDLLQAGPMLVTDGRPVVTEGDDAEGFSKASAQFDSDITAGRYPRAALALAPGRIIALAADGRSWRDAGLTLRELANLLVALGAESAINLDGGGSASLVCGGELRNRPRAEHDIELAGGRPIASALVFEPRQRSSSPPLHQRFTDR